MLRLLVTYVFILSNTLVLLVFVLKSTVAIINFLGSHGTYDDGVQYVIHFVCRVIFNIILLKTIMNVIYILYVYLYVVFVFYLARFCVLKIHTRNTCIRVTIDRIFK